MPGHKLVYSLFSIATALLPALCNAEHAALPLTKRYLLRRQLEQQIHFKLLDYAASDGPSRPGCRVRDVEFDGFSHYLTGSLRVPGSIYADCIDGVPTCFVDDGIADTSNQRVPCASVETDAQHAPTSSRQLGVFKSKVKFAWPQRVVCIRYAIAFSNQAKKWWAQAVQEYLRKADISIVEHDQCRERYGKKTKVCDDCRAFVTVVNDQPGCHATVGYLERARHLLNIRGDCESYETFLHELGHIVGLFHEHSHPERDVIVLRDKMEADASNNYAKVSKSEATMTPYDRRSVMHYDGPELCIPKDPTLKYCDITQTKKDVGRLAASLSAVKMKRKELLARCELVIKSYNPDKTTVDAHAEEQLRDLESTSDRLFVQQVFYGAYRYRELLKSLLTQFLNANASRVSRNDYTKFMVVAYLAIFRLEEMGTSAFGALVAALDPTSMHVLLSYLFDESNLQGSIKSEWVRVLDQDFVQTEIIDKMLKFRADINALLDQLHAKAFGRAAAKESLRAAGGVAPVEKKAATVPVAPNLTQPRPRKPVEPIRIPQQVKANPVPSSIHELSLADLERQKRERQAKIKDDVVKKYEAAAKEMFHFESTAKSNLEAVRQEVEAERNAQLRFDFKAKPAPEFSSQGKEIKLNTAAILREDALFKKKQAKEAKLLHAYEAELRDPMDFYRWQSTMLQQDHEKWKAEVEQRRLEMVQAQYEAIEAAHRARLENREVAIQMKAISKEKEAQRQRGEQELEERYRQQMSEIKQVRELAPREAEEKVREEKQRQREELNAFLAAERERKAAEDALEQAQREDLIRQIRALDRVHREHVVVFDPTETAQLGLLEEMSLAELRERLQVRKAEQQAWEEKRREDILVEKQEKDAVIEEKVKTLSMLRKAAAEANATRRSRKKAMEEAKRQEEEARRRQGNLQLAQKLVEQRRAREEQTERLRLEAEEIAKKRMFLGAAKSMLEENHFDQLKQGAERQARVRQTTTQKAAKTEEAVRQQSQEMRTEYLEAQRQAKQDEEAARTALFEKEREQARARARDDDEMLRAMVRHEQKRYGHAKDVLQRRNEYATKQSQRLVEGARAAADERHKLTKERGASLRSSGHGTAIQRSSNQLEDVPSSVQSRRAD
ncbi:hypothetical protein P43SY_001999 [Pythium insidiosum]|uniref:Peptidase M12A domain-containing protein n=1 Tax=Pythium insidiosum TaxID=114742 RepID=A0AAD5LKQ9_PYTIN|nr:hypothetical protein P43SY_001999 [Pythium insidiosum]